MLIIPQSGEKNKVKTNQKQPILKGILLEIQATLHKRRVAADNAHRAGNSRFLPAPPGIATAEVNNRLAGSACGQCAPGRQ